MKHNQREIPRGYCQCGCGEKTSPAPHTNKNVGYQKDIPLLYCRGHNRLTGKIGSKLKYNKNGRWINEQGYVEIFIPNHPLANKDNYVLEHRFIMCDQMNRILDRDEIVHHKNGNRSDNRIENLEIMSRADHTRFHQREWTKENIIASMQKYKKEYGKSPTVKSYLHCDYMPHKASVKREFGNWTNALKESGVGISKFSHHR